MTELFGPLLGDGIDGLMSLAPESASLILSDLPSGDTVAEFDKPPDFARLWPAVWHALKATGVVVFFASSIRFAAAVIASQPKRFRYDIVWEKSLAVGFLNAQKRPLRSHEFLLVFSRGPSTFNPQFVETGVPISLARRGDAGCSENWGKWTKYTTSRTGATDRYPRSVLRFGPLGTRDKRRVHPQQKPVDLLRNLVRQYSNKGELVVDPYAGSGSTLQAARAEGRDAIGWDSSERFARPA